jgi:dienelactone hydrolase
LVALAWGLFVGVAAVILLAVAQTGAGRVCGLAALLLGLTPRAILDAWEHRTAIKRWLAAVFVSGAAIALAVAAALKPAAAGGPRDRLMTLRADGAAYPESFSLPALVPEQDQLAFGFSVMPFVDGIFTQRQGSTLRRETETIYRLADQDPLFAATASAMPDVYRDLCGLSRTDRRIIAYIPRSAVRDQPAPVLVYYHGSGGLWRGYLWILSRVAERTGAIIVAPSGGMGHWQGDEACLAFDESLTALDRVARIDRTRVCIVGLSNGGRAVTQVLADRPAAERAAMFVSPVFDEAMLGRIERHPPISVLTGRRDDRVPIEYVETMVARMPGNGAAPNLEILDDADHFLFFTHRTLLVDRFVRWIQTDVVGK